jgi:C4-dicarboxylate-specific signal transduction histidine kinase
LGLHLSKMIIEDSLKGTLSVSNGNYGAKFSILL